MNSLENYFFFEAGVVFFAGALAAGFFAEDFPFDLGVAITRSIKMTT